jgi:hypothetical protein
LFIRTHPMVKVAMAEEEARNKENMPRVEKNIDE